jgi:anti-repressor protein
MNNIQLFENNEFGIINVIIDHLNNPWFIAKEVCEILDTQTRDIRHILDKDQYGSFENLYNWIIQNSGNKMSVDSIHSKNFKSLRRDAIILSESGMYTLILKSRKSNAQNLCRWVTEEVLPSIRKTGSYSINQDNLKDNLLRESTNALNNIKETLAITNELISELRQEKLELTNKTLQLEQKIEEDKPVLLVGQAVTATEEEHKIYEGSKIIQQIILNAGFSISKEHKPKGFFNWLREEGWLLKERENRNYPSQKGLELGYFKVSVFYDILGDTKYIPRITGKGIKYFSELILNRLKTNYPTLKVK